MKLKTRILRYALIPPLAIGASIIMGFLSFSGAWGILPLLPAALTAMGLSIAYDAEIFYQNVYQAFNKIFKPQQTERTLALQYLIKKFPRHNLQAPETPQFFRDYLKCCELLEHYEHHKLTKEEKSTQRFMKKNLRDMEKWFAIQYLAAISDTKKDQNIANFDPMTHYRQDILNWLKNQDDINEQAAILKQRKTKVTCIGIFSGGAAIFMSLGTTYLVMEAIGTLGVIGLLSATAWPLIVIPLSIFAGIGYGLMVYNAMVDMLNNNTIVKLFRDLRNDFKQGITVKNALTTLFTVTLIGLALALTLCTMGTWWTVIRENKPVVSALARFPQALASGLIAFFTGISSLMFHLENTGISLGYMQKVPAAIARSWRNMWESIFDLPQTENWLQIINPLRIVTKLLLGPIKFILFILHLTAEGFSESRIPGVNEKLAGGAGAFSEFMADIHYFVEDEHEHTHHHHEEVDENLLQARLETGGGHDHSADLPTRLLTLCATPFIFLTVLWDWAASLLNSPSEAYPHRKPLTFKEAWHKHWGHNHEESEAPLPAITPPSKGWEIEHAMYRINKFQQNNLQSSMFNKAEADIETGNLAAVKVELAALENNPDVTVSSKLDSINTERREAHDGGHGIIHHTSPYGFFKPNHTKITDEFIGSELPERVCVQVPQ